MAARLVASSGLGWNDRLGLAAGLDIVEAVAQAIAQLVRRVVGLLTTVAGGDRARGGDARGAGETEEFPTSAHGSRRLLAVNVSVLGFEEAIATAATGDLWLFRGRSLADRAIQTMTNSPVNHVGMVVALDDMPPLLWHAELGKSLPDAWTGERHRGVQLHKLADAVRTWDEKYNQRAWMRRLDRVTFYLLVLQGGSPIERFFSQHHDLCRQLLTESAGQKIQRISKHSVS